MKKNIQLIICFLPLCANAQIPNSDFELWQTIQKDIPSQWGTYGSTKKVAGYLSPSAVRIERDQNNPNSPGAVIYGYPDQNFSGGIPFRGRPDSAVVFVKRHLVSGDSAWFLVFLSRGGRKISQDNFKFSGSDSTKFIRMAFKIHYSDTGVSDSLLIGISSTNPEAQNQGSFVIIDHIGFSGGQFETIPNAEFEEWTSIVNEDPIGWLSSNINSPALSNDKLVSKSSNAALHQYAVKIKNTFSGNGYQQGYIMAGKQGNNGPLPGFAVNGRDSVLYVYYKCFPKNGDVINIGVMMYDSGQMVGTGFIRQAFAVSVWSQTPIPIDYFGGYTGIPDSAAIFCAAFSGGDPAKGASELYVDGLRFNAPWVSINTEAKSESLFNVFPNPGNDHINIKIHSFIEDQFEIELISSDGKIVYSKPFQTKLNGDNLHVIETDNFNNGIYQIHLRHKNYSSCKVITITH